MSQVRLTLISSLLTPHCNIMNDDETTCSHSTNTHMDDLMTRLKMKLLETRRECTAKPFVPFNCHAVDTLKINSEKHSFQSIRDVKISYSNRYILVSDLCFLGSNFSMIKVFDLTTSLFLKAIGPYHNGPQFLCVEDRPFLEHSYHVSDALIFSHSFLEGNSHQQQLSKFHLKQLVENEQGTYQSVWTVDVGDTSVGSMLAFDSHLYVVRDQSMIQIFNSKTGEYLTNNSGDISHHPSLFLCSHKIQLYELA